jgi:hypothetical protein
MMLSSKDDDKTITEISLISGVSVSSVKKVFEALSANIIFEYSKNNHRINIPYTGNIMIKYVDDVDTPKGKEANIDVFFSPHSQLKRIVGQINDIENKGEDPKNFDVFTMISDFIKMDFKTKITV